MPTLVLKHGIAKFDIEDVALVRAFRWHSVMSGDGKRTYASALIAGRTTYMHQLILNTKGDTDHINMNGLDNRRQNLRKATRSQNMANAKSKRGTSQYKGVSKFKRNGKWQAHIMVDYKNRFLGYFDDEAEAARAYDRAAREAWPEHARLNLPEG